MSRIVVTGAGGFIGRSCCAALAAAGHEVVACVRSPGNDAGGSKNVTRVEIPDLAKPEARLIGASAGADAIVHLADNPDRAASGEYQSLALARAVAGAAEKAGVARVIVSSSIYARLDEDGAANPYGAAKRAAEQELSDSTAFAAVTLRLPPIYGPGAKGGISVLAGLIKRGLPLPFGSATAKRDYLALPNLAALFAALVEAKDSDFAHLGAAPVEPSDGAPIATRDLAQEIASVMGQRARLLPFPPAILGLAAGLAGKGDQVAAVFEELITRPNSDTEDRLNWRPSADYAANLAYLAK